MTLQGGFILTALRGKYPEAAVIVGKDIYKGTAPPKANPCNASVDHDSVKKSNGKAQEGEEIGSLENVGPRQYPSDPDLPPQARLAGQETVQN